MRKKVTIEMDEEIIKVAQNYARRKRIKLDQLISDFLKSISDQADQGSRISPIIKEITGSIPSDISDEQLQLERLKYLLEKHS